LPPGLPLAVGIVHPLAQAQQALASSLVITTSGLQQLALIVQQGQGQPPGQDHGGVEGEARQAARASLRAVEEARERSAGLERRRAQVASRLSALSEAATRLAQSRNEAAEKKERAEQEKEELEERLEQEKEAR
jgi:hypothetical protein